MKKEIGLILGICFFLLTLNCRAQKDFSKIMKLSETIKIQHSGSLEPYRVDVKLINGKTILIADRKNGSITTTKLNGIIKNKYNLGNKGFRIFDVTLDENEAVYILDMAARFVFKLNEKGDIERKISVVRGEEILVEKGFLYLYRKLFIGKTPNEQTLYKYNLKGKLLKSFGRPPRGFDKKAAGLIGGSLVLTDTSIVVCHCFDYDVKIYSKNGDLKKNYSVKPTFYSEFNKSPDLNNPKEMKLWEKFTQHNLSLPYAKDIYISYYCSIDMTGAWLFVQNGKSNREYNLPPNLIPKFISGNKLYFFNSKTSKEKTLVLDVYEIGKDIL